MIQVIYVLKFTDNITFTFNITFNNTFIIKTGNYIAMKFQYTIWFYIMHFL